MVDKRLKSAQEKRICYSDKEPCHVKCTAVPIEFM